MGWLFPFALSGWGNWCDEPHHYGEEIAQSAEEKARRIIAEELGGRRKGDDGKVRIARWLRRETTVS